MAVAPGKQRQGLGRRCLEEAATIARAWPADAIRLDAFDAQAGAGDFYARCGWTEVGRRSYRGTPLIYYEKLLTDIKDCKPQARLRAEPKPKTFAGACPS